MVKVNVPPGRRRRRHLLEHRRQVAQEVEHAAGQDVVEALRGVGPGRRQQIVLPQLDGKALGAADGQQLRVGIEAVDLHAGCGEGLRGQAGADAGVQQAVAGPQVLVDQAEQGFRMPVVGVGLLVVVGDDHSGLLCQFGTHAQWSVIRHS